MEIMIDSISNYSDEEYKMFYGNLDVSYKGKVNKLINANDKKRCVLGQILLSIVLKEKYNLSYNEVEIKYNEYGKPFIREINYSISHSGLLVGAICSKKKIGLDIERVRQADIKTINYFCTENEKTYVLSSIDKDKAAFEVFCLKEAYFKMIGKGIGDFKSVEFEINSNTVSCNKDNLNIILNEKVTGYVIAIVEEK